VAAYAGARDRVVGWSRVPKPATVWFGGDEAGAVSHQVVMFGVRMCRGTRLPMVFGAVWAVANSCRVVGAVGSICRCMQPSGEGLIWVVGRMRRAYNRLGDLVDARAEAHDHWASWWRFTQAETGGRRVVVGRWVRAWVDAAARRGCGWWLAARTGVLL